MEDPVKAGRGGGAGSRWSRVWRGANLVMAVFFLLAAYVQLNDPDPLLWVPVYSVPALLALTLVIHSASSGSVWWRLAMTLTIGFSLGLAAYQGFLIARLHMTQPVTNPLQHEIGREMAGVLIVAVWLGLCLRVTSKSRDSDSPMGLLVPFTGVLALFPLFFWALCFVGDWHNKLGHCRDMFPS